MAALGIDLEMEVSLPPFGNVNFMYWLMIRVNVIGSVMIRVNVIGVSKRI